MYVDRHENLVWLGAQELALFAALPDIAQRADLGIEMRDLRPCGRGWVVSGVSARNLHARYLGHKVVASAHKIYIRIYALDQPRYINISTSLICD